MPKIEILANDTPEEIRIALLEDGELAEFFCERKTDAAHFLVGNIYAGRVANVLPGMDAAFVNIGFEKNAYLYITDVLPADRGKTIDKILKKDQMVMVQVIKDTIGTKGMKITLNITLPGRYLVLTPFQRQMHISRQIEENAERQRLHDCLTAVLPASYGCIVRTEAEGADFKALQDEARYLLRQWDQINKKFEQGGPARLLYKELELPLAVARDILSENVFRYLVDSPSVYRELTNFVEEIAPHLKDRIALYDKRVPIFSAYHAEEEIAKMRRSHIPLKSGGVIVIQESESMTMVDVNTARFVGATTQEETVTQTNIEAAEMVARQLRIRNIGGIIVIDFIDMRRESNRRKVLAALQAALKNDRAKVKIHPITRLGLVEMTRERKRESNLVFLTESCELCQGTGRLLSRETLFLKICREVAYLLQGRSVNSIRIQASPPLCKYYKENAKRLQHSIGVQETPIVFQEDPALQWEDFKIILE